MWTLRRARLGLAETSATVCLWSELRSSSSSYPAIGMAVSPAMIGFYRRAGKFAEGKN